MPSNRDAAAVDSSDLSREQLIERLEQKDGQVERLREELSQMRVKTTTDDKCNKCGLSQREWQATLSSLDKLRTKCQVAEAERDQAREELRSVEKEMEELHDNFKEEESEQFEQLKQELDLALKNCKILQIRLNKSERQFSQLEQVKSMLERQLGEATSGKSPQKQSNQDPLTDTSQVSSYAQVSSNLVSLSNEEYDQLLRDLNDTNERAKDLQEQVKYSLEEAKMKGDKLRAVEAENELLLAKMQKLTASNARLRAMRSHSASTEMQEAPEKSNLEDTGQLIEQNEQLKLALEVTQAECKRLKEKLQQVNSELETKQETRQQSSRVGLKRQMGADEQNGEPSADEASRSTQVTKLELEIRQLRTRLVHSERESKQLKAQLELAANCSSNMIPSKGSFESAGEQARYMEINRQLQEQCSSLAKQNTLLESRIEQLSSENNVGNTELESSLLGKLKRQLETSEQELANTKSRLVELDVDYSRLQREHKRLVESLEGRAKEQAAQLARRVKLPPEAQRDTMSRQELRQAIKDLEGELESLLQVIRARECSTGSIEPLVVEDATKSLQRQLEEERATSGQLRAEVAKLEGWRAEMQAKQRMLERERTAMEEELDKLRQVNAELNGQLEEAKRNQRSLTTRLKEAQLSCDKLRNMAGAAGGSVQTRIEESTTTVKANGGDLLLMARDLSELKVKNGFLMRQLELAREEQTRLLEEARQSAETQQRRAVELAQLELKERQLSESQQLRDEMNELKQRLAGQQRQLSRAEEEASGERDRARATERDWRREKSQWLQRTEQLEAQLAIQQRSYEFRLKDAECSLREKERELIAIQDRCVQVERDLQRAQNKHKLLEENSEAKQQQLTRELEAKKRELSELIGQSRTREEEYYENCKRFNAEKATLVEALESVRRSYDEKIAELKSARELIVIRQDQAYKERQAALDKIDSLSGQLLRAAEQETQTSLVKQRLETQERQVEALRRELAQLKEDRTRAKKRCEELERRCHSYEKQELISKTSTISTNAFLKARNPFASSRASDSSKSPLTVASKKPELEQSPNQSSNESLVERLSGKIKDQRQLMNMLKQQHDELQMELKQVKLLLGAERNKWQCRVSQLQGMLHEAEERLLFESSHQLSKETLDAAQRRLEAKWSAERRATLENLQQQQAQNELLVRDLKKLGQSHDLLRLQAKQLESHNHKLSRRLIEFEQTRPTTGSLEQRLSTCQDQRDDLSDECERLTRHAARLERLLREQVQPIVDQLAKLLSSDSSGDLEPPKTSSTSRPLMISSATANSSAKPAPQQVASQQSRLARMLGARSPSSLEPESAPGDQSANPTTSKGKVVRRVKVRRSSLGLSVQERKDLRRRLTELRSGIAELGQGLGPLEQAATLSQPPAGVQRRASSEKPASKLSGGGESPSVSSRVHWQLDSDLDSERSWSTSQLNESHANLYRRFPQATPTPMPTSLTDYESESSLASELSAGYSTHRSRFSSSAGGAESDSGLQSGATGSSRLNGRKRSGLKSRLTSTLRNISRSISGLATSDSELDSLHTKRSREADEEALRECRV